MQRFTGLRSAAGTDNFTSDDTDAGRHDVALALCELATELAPMLTTPLHAETMSPGERDALLRCVPVPYSLRRSVRLHRRDTAIHRRRRRVHLTLSDRLAVGRFEDEKRLSTSGGLAFIAFVVGGIGLY